MPRDRDGRKGTSAQSSRGRQHLDRESSRVREAGNVPLAMIVLQLRASSERWKALLIGYPRAGKSSEAWTSPSNARLIDLLTSSSLYPSIHTISTTAAHTIVERIARFWLRAEEKEGERREETTRPRSSDGWLWCRCRWRDESFFSIDTEPRGLRGGEGGGEKRAENMLEDELPERVKSALLLKEGARRVRKRYSQ